MPFRLVYTEFWEDPKVIEEMTPEDKYFYLYLLTNPKTNMIGIYKITKKQISFDIGYSIESVNSLMDRFVKHHKLILYNEKTREICIRNYGKYNLNKGGKPMFDCIKKDLSFVENKEFIRELIGHVQKPLIRQFIEDYYDTSHDTSPIRENEEDDTLDDTSTTRGTTGGHNHNPKSIIQNPKSIIHNPNTNTSSSLLSEKIKSNMDVFKFLDKCNFIMSPLTMEKIAADIEIYSAFEVARAAEIADGNGKRSYSYLKGILEKRRAGGTDTNSNEEANNGTGSNRGNNSKDTSTEYDFSKFETADGETRDVDCNF